MILICNSSKIFATEQVPDYLIFNGDTVSIYSNPLEEKHSFLFRDTSFYLNTCMSTACWRRYKATWEISDDVLYLVSISDCCNSKLTAKLELVFPGKVAEGKVKADWFTGKLIVPIGEVIYGEHMGYSRVSQYEDIIKIENGRLIEVKRVDNTGTSLPYMREKNLSNYLIRNLDNRILNEIRKKEFSLDFYVDVRSDSLRRVTGVVFKNISEIKYENEIRNALLLIDDWNVLYRRGEIAQLPWIYPVKISWKDVAAYRRNENRKDSNHNKPSDKPTVYVYEDKIIYQDDTVYLYESQFHHVNSILGKKVDIIEWNDFSYEHKSNKRGISMSYRQNDSLEIIRWFNAELKKVSVVINGDVQLSRRPSVEEIFRYFGEGQWSYDDSYNDLCIEYDYFDFIIELKTSDKKFIDNFNEHDWDENYQLFKNNRILEIEVY